MSHKLEPRQLPPNSSGKVLLFADGVVEFTNFGPFIMNSDGAAKIIAEHKRRGIRIGWDYEHQTYNKSHPEAKAPASGWIPTFAEDKQALTYVKGEGLWAKVKWNEEARQEIKDEKYLYYSPTFDVDKGGVINTLGIIALTNAPATVRLEPLVAKNDFLGNGGNTMPNISELAALLGLEEGASVEQVVDSINDDNFQSVVDYIRGFDEAGLPEDINVDTLKVWLTNFFKDEAPAEEEVAQDETVEEVPTEETTSEEIPPAAEEAVEEIVEEVIAINDTVEKLIDALDLSAKDLPGVIEEIKLRTENPTGFVATSEYEKLQKDNSELSEKMKEKDEKLSKHEFNTICAKDENKGKIVASLQDWAYKSYCMSEDHFKEWLKKAPVIAPTKPAIAKSTKIARQDGTSGRLGMIFNAKDEWNNLELKLCKRDEFINERLRLGNEKPMSDGEVKDLGE